MTRVDGLIMLYFSGISSFVLNPSAASESLSPLLDYAAQQVPAEKRPETPLYIMATAGMRLLSDRSVITPPQQSSPLLSRPNPYNAEIFLYKP